MRDDLGRRVGPSQLVKVPTSVGELLMAIELRASLAAAPTAILGLDRTEEKRHGTTVRSRIMRSQQRLTLGGVTNVPSARQMHATVLGM